MNGHETELKRYGTKQVMWLVALVCLGMALLTLLPQPVSANAGIAQDARTLEQCVARETQAGRRAWACIEAVSGPCLAATRETTADMNFCLQRSTDAWDAVLNQNYQALMRGWQASDQAEPQAILRNAQRAWITYRDNACTAEAFLYRGGTLQGVIVGACLEQQTALRAIDLIGLLRDQNQ
ncbi:MAG: lysozyme inhibitor LprI family protein [Pseudomonadota bacterium]